MMSMFASCDEALTVRDAVRWIRSQTGVTPTVETIHRWMRKGVRGRVLPSWRVGGVWYVSPADLATFIEAGDRRAARAPAPASSTRQSARSTPARREERAASKAELKRRLGRTP
jgi:hypothetical protein